PRRPIRKPMHDRGTTAFSALIGVGIALTAAAALIVTWLPRERTAVPAAAQPAAGVRSIDVPRIPYGPAEASKAPTPAALAYLSGGAPGAAVYAAAGSPAPAQAWLTSAGVPSSTAASAGAAVTHPFVVWTGPVAAANLAGLQRFAQAGGVLVIDGDSP